MRVHRTNRIRPRDLGRADRPASSTACLLLRIFIWRTTCDFYPLRAKRSRKTRLMVCRSVSTSLAALAGACLFLLPVPSADAVGVAVTEGTGPDSAQVIFNFPNGFIAEYTANYNTPSGTIDGYDLTQIAGEDPNLTLAFTNYGTANAPDYFLNNATYAGGGTSVGLSYSSSTPNNYWHEYYNDGAGYVFGDGASVDTITNGGAIGWVFGSNNLPVSVPEPASLSLIAGGSVLLLRRRRA